MVESLTNLDKIENGRALVFMLPLKIVGIEACVFEKLSEYLLYERDTLFGIVYLL